MSRLRKANSVSMAMQRQTTVGQKADYSASPAGTLTFHMQPLDATYAALIGGNFSKSFMGWPDVNADIKVGDKGVVATGKLADTYYVQGVKTYDVGSKKMRHLEVIFEAKDA